MVLINLNSSLVLARKLKALDLSVLKESLSTLDPAMEQEIEEIKQRYNAKRNPILMAIDAKRAKEIGAAR